MAIAGLLATAVLIASLVPLDLYGLVPRDVSAVEPLVEVTGDVETFPADDSTFYVTVGSPKLSALGAVMAWLDPDADVRTPEELFGDQTPEEYREQNLELMGYSKELAGYVAASRLGLDVGVSGGGPVIRSLCLEEAADGSCVRASPADEVLDPGDAIVELDGTEINLLDDLAAVLGDHQPGDVVPVVAVRDGERVGGEIELAASDDGRTIVGFIPEDGFLEPVEFDLPFGIEIDSGGVGGPSAGLAFTLTLVDLLTPGSLTGGKKVAATGAIQVDGTVGPIGGLHQKTTAVKESGAEVFLVPADQVAEAEAEAEGSDLQIIGVRNLDDALAALGRLGGDLSGIPDPPQA